VNGEHDIPFASVIDDPLQRLLYYRGLPRSSSNKYCVSGNEAISFEGIAHPKQNAAGACSQKSVTQIFRQMQAAGARRDKFSGLG
jgi:hypothetical protein